MATTLEQGLGILLTCLVLLDIFLTVLYARIGTSIIMSRVAHLVWAVLSHLSAVVGSRRGVVLSYCGPIILVLLVCVWSMGLTLGSALVMHPQLGSAIKATNGETPTDFVTALYAGGTSMAFVGASDFTPHTSGSRLLFLVNSLIGMSAMSLTLTYLMQVYTALQRRNVLAMNIHLLSQCTGDAAELLSRIVPANKFTTGYTHLSDLAGAMTEAKEDHHFYPVLFYFRFDDSHHSVSRSTLVALDLVSLIRSALADEGAAWLKESGAATQLREASMLLLVTLEETFLPQGAPEDARRPDEEREVAWRARYRAARSRLQQAGVSVAADPVNGERMYLEYRMKWDHHVRNLAPFMAYSMREIDVATPLPDVAGQSGRIAGHLQKT